MQVEAKEISILSFIIAILATTAIHAKAPGDTESSYLRHFIASERPKIAKKIGIPQISELIEYTVLLSIANDLKSFDAIQNVAYPNRTGKLIHTLYFRVYPNALPPVSKPRMKITQVLVNGRKTIWKSKGTILKVKLIRPLNPGAWVNIQLHFKARIPTIKPGRTTILMQALEQITGLTSKKRVQKADYGILSLGDEILTMGIWHPVVASYGKDGWDRTPPSGIGDVTFFDLANFTVSVTTPEKAVIAASGIPVHTTSSGRQKTTVFIASAVRNFALVLSKKFAVSKARVSGTTVRSYYLRKDAQKGRRVLAQAVASLRIFNRLFTRYPYKHLNVAEAALIGGAGGVEFPCLITAASMFYRNEKGSWFNELTASLMGDMLEFVVVHEVAHQWWNALIGSNSREKPFVDEALSQYSAALYFEDVHGKAALERQLEMQMKLNYRFHRLLGGKDQRADLPAGDYASPLEYAAIVYGKAPLYFHELRKAIGDAAFFKALKSYAENYAFKIAEPRSFTNHAKTVSGQPEVVEQLYKRWIEGKYGDKDIGKLNLGQLLTTLLGGTHNSFLGKVLSSALGGVKASTLKSLLGKGGGLKNLLGEGGLLKGLKSLLGGSNKKDGKKPGNIIQDLGNMMKHLFGGK